MGKKRVCTLAYDIAVIAESKEKMKGMIKEFERYLKGKGLKLNVEKTKIMRCRKGGEKWKTTDWKWKGKELKEVREFSYLGYVIRSNGRQNKYAEDRLRRAVAILG